MHPTQLYEMLAGLFLFGLLMFLRRVRRFSGMPFLGWVIGYGILRPIIEMYRDDDQRGSVGPLSTSQFIGITSVVLGVALLVFLLRRYRQDPAVAAPVGAAAGGERRAGGGRRRAADQQDFGRWYKSGPAEKEIMSLKRSSGSGTRTLGGSDGGAKVGRQELYDELKKLAASGAGFTPVDVALSIGAGEPQVSRALLGLAAEGCLEKVETGKYRVAAMFGDLTMPEFLKVFNRASKTDSTRQRDLSEIARLKQNNDIMRGKLLAAIAERDHYLAALKTPQHRSRSGAGAGGQRGCRARGSRRRSRRKRRPLRPTKRPRRGRTIRRPGWPEREARKAATCD